jgi:hypothetical protein
MEIKKPDISFIPEDELKEYYNTNPEVHSCEKRMLFKIPVGDIPEDQIEEYIRNISSKIKYGELNHPDFGNITLPFLKNKFKMEKEEVYRRINGELIYQDVRWDNDMRPDNIPDEDKPVAEWLNYIEFHLEKAKNCNYHLKRQLALAEIRKIAALSVKALIVHGCPERDFTNGEIIWKNNNWVNNKTGEPIANLNNDECNHDCNNCDCDCKKQQEE